MRAAQRWPRNSPLAQRGPRRPMRGSRFQNAEMPTGSDETGSQESPEMPSVQDGGDEQGGGFDDGGEDFMPDESTRRDCAQLGDDWGGINEDLQQMGINLANAKCYLVNGNELHVISEEIRQVGDEEGGPADAAGGENPAADQPATGGDEVALEKRGRSRGTTRAKGPNRSTPRAGGRTSRRVGAAPQRRTGSTAWGKYRSPMKSRHAVAKRPVGATAARRVTRPRATAAARANQKKKA